MKVKILWMEIFDHTYSTFSVSLDHSCGAQVYLSEGGGSQESDIYCTSLGLELIYCTCCPGCDIETRVALG